MDKDKTASNDASELPPDNRSLDFISPQEQQAQQGSTMPEIETSAPNSNNPLVAGCSFLNNPASMILSFHDGHENQDSEEDLRNLYKEPEATKLPWWPWPRKGKKVPYPGCWKKSESFEKRDNPFEHHAAGVWWLSYVFCGGDRSTLNIPEEHFTTLKELYGWDKPQLEYKEHEIEHLGHQGRVNALTVLPFMGGFFLLRKLRQTRLDFIYYPCLVLSLTCVPSLIVIIAYGLIPVGEISICTIENYGVWLYVTMPGTSLLIESGLFFLLFASVDAKCPWRPMWLYAPVLIISYISKIVIYLPIVYTVGTYSMLLVCVLTLSFMSFYAGSWVFRREFLNYELGDVSFKKLKHDLWRPKSEKMDPIKYQRLICFYKIALCYFVAMLVYSAYLLGIEFGSETLQTVTSLLLSIWNLMFRKFTQHFGTVLPREMNFLLSALGVYAMHAIFVSFSTPNISGFAADAERSLGTYIAIFIGPLSDCLAAFFHQSDLWFRFRNWVKKIALPILACKKTDYQALGVEWDMDNNGRGCTNAHPDYRRTKVFYDIYSFTGSMAGYASFILVSWVLALGPNKSHFPYYEGDDSILGNQPYTKEDFNIALSYAGFVFFLLLFSKICYKFYLRRFYPKGYQILNICYDNYILYPHMVGLSMVMITLILLYVTGTLLTFNRVWYFDFGKTYGSCL